MSGKALPLLLPTALFVAGCAVFPAKPAPSAPDAKAVASPAHRPAGASVATPVPRSEPRRNAPRPRSAATPASSANATSTATPGIASKPGAPAAQPVPLFRQAIVLANVRAAVAGLPSAPHAEFRQGLLTLSFRGATPEQISTAVNRAMSVPEVSRVQVVQAP